MQTREEIEAKIIDISEKCGGLYDCQLKQGLSWAFETISQLLDQNLELLKALQGMVIHNHAADIRRGLDASLELEQAQEALEKYGIGPDGRHK